MELGTRTSTSTPLFRRDPDNVLLVHGLPGFVFSSPTTATMQFVCLRRRPTCPRGVRMCECAADEVGAAGQAHKSRNDMWPRCARCAERDNIAVLFAAEMHEAKRLVAPPERGGRKAIADLSTRTEDERGQVRDRLCQGE